MHCFPHYNTSFEVDCICFSFIYWNKFSLCFLFLASFPNPPLIAFFPSSIYLFSENNHFSLLLDITNVKELVSDNSLI